MRLGNAERERAQKEQGCREHQPRPTQAPEKGSSSLCWLASSGCLILLDSVQTEAVEAVDARWVISVKWTWNKDRLCRPSRPPGSSARAFPALTPSRLHSAWPLLRPAQALGLPVTAGPSQALSGLSVLPDAGLCSLRRCRSTGKLGTCQDATRSLVQGAGESSEALCKVQSRLATTGH